MTIAIYKKLLFAGLFAAVLPAASAQLGAPSAAGARGVGLAGASVAFDDVNSAFSNQAGTAFVENMSFSAFGEQRFLVPGLNTFGFVALYPVKKIGTLGLTFNYFGMSAYNEQKIGLIYARQLSKSFSLGVKFDYIATRIPDYGVAHNFTGEVGFLYKVSKQFSLGAHVYNPFFVKLPSGDDLATVLRAGLLYSPSPQVSLAAEVEKDLLYPISGKLGIEYRPIAAVAFRAGFSSAPFKASFGVGLRWSDFLIDFASSYHETLGFSPAVSFGYVAKKKVATPKAVE